MSRHHDRGCVCRNGNVCAACRGIFPAAGSVVVCSRAPNYIAAHSTEPAQIVHQDLTNPLVRTLKLKKSAGKNASRKRKGSPASAAKCATCTFRGEDVGLCQHLAIHVVMACCRPLQEG